MYLGNMSFLQRHAPKKPSTFPSASAGELSTELGQSKTIELVSETRIVLFILSVGLKSGDGIIFLKVLRRRSTGEDLGLFVGKKGKRKGTSLASSASF